MKQVVNYHGRPCCWLKTKQKNCSHCTSGNEWFCHLHHQHALESCKEIHKKQYVTTGKLNQSTLKIDLVPILEDLLISMLNSQYDLQDLENKWLIDHYVDIFTLTGHFQNIFNINHLFNMFLFLPGQNNHTHPPLPPPTLSKSLESQSKAQGLGFTSVSFYVCGLPGKNGVRPAAAEGSQLARPLGFRILHNCKQYLQFRQFLKALSNGLWTS